MELEGRCVPSTITPTTFADGGLGSGSLRDAVLQLNADPGSDDDLIQLQVGTYTLTLRNTGGHHETAGLEGDLNITSTAHRLIIQGAGSSGTNATIVDASQLQDRVFEIVHPGTQVVFQDLVIQGGLAQDDGSDGALAGSTDALGGGILNNGGHVTLDDVVLQNNVARGGDAAVLSAPGHNASGGGVYSTGGALTIAGATMANNQALGGRGGDYNGHQSAGNGGSAGGGGLYATGGSLDISDTMITGNRATGGQGGNGFFTGTGGNGATGQGGGLYVNGSSLTIAASTISSNQGSGGSAGLYGGTGDSSGGGAYNGSLSTLTVSNSTLSGNSATGTYDIYGGGIYNLGTLTVSNSSLSGNFAGSLGGGIDNHGTLTVSNSTLSGNSATFGHGGGIENGGTLTVSNSTLSGNSALYTGGGIYNNGTLTVSNSTLSNNSGGGITNGGTLTVSDSTLSGNLAEFGGGIDSSGTLTVSNSTLSGNCAGGGGGGIYNYGMLTVSDSTLSGNCAGGGGGGISTSGTHPVTLTNVTLTANQAGSSVSSHGGGLYVGTGAPVLHNTLIAGNFRGDTGTTADDVYGPLDASGDYSLIGDGTGMTGLSDGVNGNLVGSHTAPIDPLLGPLQDNGGPTQTHALLAGSPALNAGNPSQLGTADQRGVLRSGGVNIGAYQASASALVRTAPDTVPAGVPFSITVQAVDPFGQTAVGYQGMVHFTASNGAMADYTFTATDAGQHTFAGLVVRQAGALTVTGTDTSNDSVTGSTSFTVTPAAADHLVFLQPPTDTAAGQTLSPVVVAVVDQFGNVETGDNSDTVTLSLGVNPGGTLSGTRTLTVVNGVATFGDLSIDQAGVGYTLHATVGGGVPDIDSNAFRIT
jgi:hypothetical protein